MLGELVEVEEPRDESRGASGGVVRKGLPFAAAFLAGFLLGRSRGDEAEGTATGEQESWVSETGDHQTGTQSQQTATEQPSSMGSVAGEEERQRERGEGEGEGETQEAEKAEGKEEEPTELTDDEMADLAGRSAPTTHGMPLLGLGTYQMDEYDECFGSVRTAIEMGYRHIDTAEGYENEDAVGDAIATADVDREDLYVATKISPENLDYDRVLTNAEESLDRLGLDYVDLLYVHWPTGEYEATDTLDAFAELRQEGLIEEIGVSNFTVELLEEAIEVSEEPIFADQVEMHPLLPQTELQQFCAQEDSDVELVAYSPIARGEVEDVDELRDIAEKHDATPAQVSLAWLREKGVAAIPKATDPQHLRENWLSLDLELDDEDVERIDAIEETERIVDPDAAPWNQ